MSGGVAGPVVVDGVGRNVVLLGGGYSHTILTSTPTEFRLYAHLDAYEGERRAYCATWERAIPRDHV